MNRERRHFDDLVSAVCYGHASPDQLEELADLLRTDDAALDEYLRQVDMHALLGGETELVLARHRAQAEPSAIAKHRKSFTDIWRYDYIAPACGIAAVAIGIVLSVLSWNGSTPEDRRTPVVVVPSEPPSDRDATLQSQAIQKNPTAQVVMQPADQPANTFAASTDKPTMGSDNRPKSTVDLYPGRSASATPTRTTQLPTHYSLPAKYRGKSQLTFAATTRPTSNEATRKLRAKLRALVSAQTPTKKTRPRPSDVPTESAPASPLWRRSGESQFSMSMTTFTFGWREIDVQ